MLRGKIFEKNEEIRIGGQICPLPVCLGLTLVFYCVGESPVFTSAASLHLPPVSKTFRKSPKIL